MKFYEQDKNILIDNIVSTFNLKENQAIYIINILEKAVFENDEEIFYYLKYTVHFQNNPQYAKKILQCALKTYTYVLSHAGYKEYRALFSKFYLQFFETIFRQRCRYSKKIEKRSDTTQKILQHLSTELNEILHRQELMIANISHEMRTSLNSISGYLSLLEDKHILNGEDESFLQKALNASNTLNHLVSDILDVTKINSGQLEIKEEYFWVDELLMKCIDTFSLELNNKNIPLNIDIDVFPKKVYADQQHIYEIFSNLLGNAIKYTKKGSISISLKRIPVNNDSIQLHFQIQDTGIGMTKEQTKYIFDPYSRFKTEEKGIGLGLHISSKLAQKLKATLTVSSKYNKGSMFDFIIPCKEDTNSTLNLNDRCIYYYSENNTFPLKEKIKYLEDIGAKLTLFIDEKEFINHLLTEQISIPNIISISAEREHYTKFDALINYLKTLSQYHNTHFIAENTGGSLSLRYFEKVFDYYAPLSYLTSQKVTTKDSQQLSKNNKQVNILVVDDIQTNLEIFYKFVNKRYPEINIDMANGGYESIGMYKTKVYDMIFLDLKMPGLGGLEVIKRLNGIRSLPPTYALTADVYKTTYEQVVQAGFTQLLEKPLQLDILYKTIEGVINV